MCFKAPAVVGAFNRFAVALAKGEREGAVRANVAQRKSFSGGIAAEYKRDVEQHCAHKLASAHLFAAQRGIPEAPEHFVSVILCCWVTGSHE
jgi:hypothetical protein